MAKLLTIAQAAERIGVSAGTLSNQVRRGKLRAIKPGTDWLVTEAEADRYAKENRRPLPAESASAVEHHVTTDEQMRALADHPGRKRSAAILTTSTVGDPGPDRA